MRGCPGQHRPDDECYAQHNAIGCQSTFSRATSDHLHKRMKILVSREHDF
jgi:hypothetical protein